MAKSRAKGCLKIGLIGLGILAIIALIAYFILNKPLPKGEEGPKAEALAAKMMASTNSEAWDSTRFLQWTFVNRQHYVWDQEKNIVEVKWKKNRVVLNLNSLEAKAWQDQQAVSGKDLEKLKAKAWSHWCNDSFWFKANRKVFDPGTSRKLVQTEDGEEALLITYDSGGVTPGDSYLWFLDDDGRPISYQMWVKIFPVGGAKYTWEGWKELSTGAIVSTLHDGPIGLELKNVKAGMTIEDLDLEYDPFAP